MSHPPLGFTSLPGCNWSMIPGLNWLLIPPTSHISYIPQVGIKLRSSNLYNNKITTAHVLPDVYILFPTWVNISWITPVVHRRLLVNCFLPKLSLWRHLTFWLDTHLQSLLANPCFIRHHNHHYRLVNFSISIECLLEIVRRFPRIYGTWCASHLQLFFLGQANGVTYFVYSFAISGNHTLCQIAISRTTSLAPHITLVLTG